MIKTVKKLLMILLSVCFMLGLGACVTSSSEHIPTVQELIKINRTQALATRENGVYITESQLDGSGNSIHTVEHNYYYKNEELVYNRQESDGTNVYSFTFVEGVEYAVGAGYYYFGVYRPQDYSHSILNWAIKDLGEQSIVGGVELKDDSFYLKAVDLESLQNTEYFFNRQSWLVERAIVTDKDGETVIKQFDFSLNAGEQIIDARQAHKLSEDKITLELNIVNEDIVSKEYEVSSSSILISEEGYEFYKTENLNKDTQTLWFSSEDKCSVYYAKEVDDIILKYTLTQDDFDCFEKIVDEMVQGAEGDCQPELLFEKQYEIYELTEYILTQYQISQIIYFQNVYNLPTYYDYVEAYAGYLETQNYLKTAYRQIYESDYAYKEEFFADWTQEKLSIIYEDESLNEITLEMKSIEDEFNMLAMDDEQVWSENVRKLMCEYVELANEYANLNDYDNYYEYASKQEYMRDYDLQETQDFRSYLKQYIVPLAVQLKNEYLEKRSALTDEQWASVTSIRNDDFRDLEHNFVQKYIDSYSGVLNQRFNAMFDKSAFIVAENPFAYQGAFVTYLSYYEEPYAYFSSNYCDTFTIVHEMGHYASVYSFNWSTLNLDFAETHSQANELLLLKFLEGYMDEQAYEVFYLYKMYRILLNLTVYTMVDEFEYTVYTAQEPYTAEELDEVMAQIYSSYHVEELIDLETVQFYWKHVTLYAPIYYLSYATSMVAALNFTVISNTQGYEQAQQVYQRLQTEGASEKFKENLILIGLNTPFDEQTYIDLTNAFND